MRRQTNKKMMMKNVMEVTNPMRNLIDQPTLSDQHTGYLHPLSRQILLASEIMVCLGLFLGFRIINPYSVAQYVCSALIMFVSAQVLEGINLSLLSQVMSSRLSRGTYNGALLSTEAGTIARVIADGTITVAGYLGGEKGPQCHLNALSLNLCGIHCRHVSHLQFSLLKSP